MSVCVFVCVCVRVCVCVCVCVLTINHQHSHKYLQTHGGSSTHSSCETVVRTINFLERGHVGIYACLIVRVCVCVFVCVCVCVQVIL